MGPLLSSRGNNAPYRLIIGYLSIFIGLAGVICLLPLLMIAIYPTEWGAYPAFLIPGGAAVIIGVVMGLILLKRDNKSRLGKHQDSVLLVLIWLFTVFIGALPFFLARYLVTGPADPNQLTMSFSEAVFESVSGYSATGYSVTRELNFLADIDVPLTDEYYAKSCAHVFLFYRALTQFFGGVGLVLIVTSAISDRYGLKLFFAEGHNDRLLPNLAKTAKITFSIYCGIILLGSFVLWLFGVDYFEAICQSACAMATGGFATRYSGFYYYFTEAYPGNGLFTYNYIGAETTMCIIMLLGATSFLLIYNLITGKVKNFVRDCEVRFMTIFLIMAIGVGTLFCTLQYDNGAGIDGFTAFRYAGFQIISCLTTTGFGNAPSVNILGPGIIALSILAMVIGGGSGSTAGASKQLRVVVALKQVWWSIKFKLSPSRQVRPHNIVRAGKTVEVTPELYKENSIYLLIYLITLVLITFFTLLVPNMSAENSLYLVASGLSGTGNTVVDFLAYGASNPLWAYNWLLWFMSLSMFLGRLEIMPMYYAIVRVGKDVLHQETV